MVRFLLFDEAVAVVRELARVREAERIPTERCVGRILAEDVQAAVSMPPFDRAMMDGFAVRAEDVAASARLKVTGAMAAGQTPTGTVGPGEAVRITTGAAMPAGANAVARFEWCTTPEPGIVQVLRPVAAGESVQTTGADARAGTVLLRKGTALGWMEQALLRTFGVAEVTVYRRPSVAIVVTGSELVTDLRVPLQPGQIYGCNDLLMHGLVAASGGDVHAVDHVPDDLATVCRVVEQRASEVDCIITTGGVSVGDHDYVPGALVQLGAALHVEKVWLRPGSPFLAATLGSCTVFSLSGNPAACLVQFEALVSNWFEASFGRTTPTFPYTGQLAADIDLKPVKHTRVLRAKAAIRDGIVRVDTGFDQSTGVLSNLAECNCLIRLDESQAKSGTVVPLRWLRPL
jgi:molybdopterin molybdotransferase